MCELKFFFSIYLLINIAFKIGPNRDCALVPALPQETAPTPSLREASVLSEFFPRNALSTAVERRLFKFRSFFLN